MKTTFVTGNQNITPYDEKFGVMILQIYCIKIAE